MFQASKSPLEVNSQVSECILARVVLEINSLFGISHFGVEVGNPPSPPTPLLRNLRIHSVGTQTYPVAHLLRAATGKCWGLVSPLGIVLKVLLVGEGFNPAAICAGPAGIWGDLRDTQPSCRFP